jgi:hypothetical protein
VALPVPVGGNGVGGVVGFGAFSDLTSAGGGGGVLGTLCGGIAAVFIGLAGVVRDGGGGRSLIGGLVVCEPGNIVSSVFFVSAKYLCTNSAC